VRHITPQRCAQFSCIFLLLICASTSRGQTSAGLVQQNIQNRERVLSSLRTEANRSSNEIERERRLFQQALKQDFRQLQIVNNEVMKQAFLRSSNTSEEIKRKEIRSGLGEMQDVARRLRTNLRLPEVKTARKAASPESTFNAGLLILDETVSKFVENPIFQQPRVLDAEMSFRAAEDLDEILRLTEALRKLAKK
jgi:hypothetical protein